MPSACGSSMRICPERIGPRVSSTSITTVRLVVRPPRRCSCRCCGSSQTQSPQAALGSEAVTPNPSLHQKCYSRLLVNSNVRLHTILVEVTLYEIKDWKIKGGNDSFLSLHIFTYADREHCVSGLGRLGMRDLNKVVKTLAKCLRNQGKK
jgi:hypothetical protein